MDKEKEEKLKELMEGESLEEVTAIAKDVCDGSLYPTDSKENILKSLSDVFQKAYAEHHLDDESRSKTAERAFPDFDDLLKLIESYYPYFNQRVLDEFDDSDLLEKLEYTHELSMHDEQVRQDYYDNDLREMIKLIWEEKTNLSLWLTDMTPDELWQRFCDAFYCAYYDKERFLKGFEEFKKKLFSSTYYQYIQKNNL